MRYFVCVLGLAGVLSAQTLTEFGAAAAGGAAGSAAGRKVSDGLTGVLNKVDQTVNAASGKDKAAAKTANPDAASNSAAAPVKGAASADSGPSGASAAAAPKKPAATRAAKQQPRDPSLVPPPPPIQQRAGVTIKRPPAEPEVAVAPPPPPPAPLPQVSRDELITLALGTQRDELLKLGLPASRVSMVDGSGRLLEIYHYIVNNSTLGIVQLSDGTVSSVQLR